MLEQNEKLLGQARKTRGYLSKRSSGFLGIWQKRYFIIIDHKLCYYADETLEYVKKSIHIDEIDSIKVFQDREFYLFTKKRIYQLQADDEPTRELWVASLNMLINYKHWGQITTQRKLSNNSKSKSLIKRSPKSKKIYSNPKLSAEVITEPSLNSPKKYSEPQFNPIKFLKMVCLTKLSQNWHSQKIRNKIILLKQKRKSYFIISCKTLNGQYQDDDFLEQQMASPYDFNCLYYYQNNKAEHPEVIEICRCKDILNIHIDNNTLQLTTANKTIEIDTENIWDLNEEVKRIKMAREISKEYHNKYNIRLKRNIDPLIYYFQQEKKSMQSIVLEQLEKCRNQIKQPHLKEQFRKLLEMLKRVIKQIINACLVKVTPVKKFKELFIKQFYELIFQELHRNWGQIKQYVTLVEMKKIITSIYNLWRLMKDDAKDDRLLSASISIQEMLIKKYEVQILSKMDVCFQLKEAELLDYVNIQGNNANNKVEKKGDLIFLSNNIFRQFHLDIRLILYQIPSLPTHQKTLTFYFSLFRQVFRHISEKTFNSIDKWQNIQLILGTCNEIQFIKNVLFEEIHNTLIKEYKHLDGLLAKIKRQNLKQLENQINNIEIMMVKKLFIMIFTNIDCKILNKNFDQLNVSEICEKIIEKLKKITKINKYVKKNIFEASFEEICYFYYTCIIKYNQKMNQEFTSDIFIKKINEEIKNIGKFFEQQLQNEKIYAHLKDLSLIKQFMQSDVSQLKKMCENLKKQFGNSFTEQALKNLLSIRSINEEMYDHIITQCFQIIKNSVQSPEDSFGLSCKSQSFLQNWNNTRSRKSTLTLSLNQFHENQTTMIKNKYKCSKSKEGYLIRKKVSRNMASNEKRYFYRISKGQLFQFQLGNQQENEHINNYELLNIKKCFIHPEKAYAFILQFGEVKLQFKAQTNDEAKEWIKNVYEQINCLSVMIDSKQSKVQRVERDRYIQLQELSLQKDPSTMSSEHTEKNRSVEKSILLSPTNSKKMKKNELKINPNEVSKAIKSENITPRAEEGCYQCSKGLFS